MILSNFAPNNLLCYLDVEFFSDFLKLHISQNDWNRALRCLFSGYFLAHPFSSLAHKVDKEVLVCLHRLHGSPSLDILSQVPVLLVHADEEGPGLEGLLILVPVLSWSALGRLLHFAPSLDDFFHLFASLLILLILSAAGVRCVAGAASGFLMAGCRRVLVIRWVLDHFLLSSACEGWSRRKLVLPPWPLCLCCSRWIVSHVQLAP